MVEDLVYRLRKRAEIRRQIPTRKSVQNNEPDRLADLLEEAANALEKREWVPLTDEEAWGVYRTLGLSFHRPNHIEEYEWALCMRDFARDIEAKLKEKNT